MMRRICAVILSAPLLLAPAIAHAQQQTSVVGTLLLTRLDRELVPVSGNPANESFSGVALGFEGTLPVWRFELDVRYSNGNLSSNIPELDLDIVEAEVLVGLRPLPWVVLKAGPHARAFKTVRSTERWLFWEIRARVEAGLLTPRLESYLELWGALVGNVNFGQSFGSGRGVEAGLIYQHQSLPLMGRIGYRIDRGSVSGGSIFDSIQQVLIGVGYRP